MNKRISISELAQMAGVSPATVSLVLNERPLANRIAENTRTRITALAKKMNYRANHLAKAMVQQSTKTIGFICGEIGNPFYAELAEALSWTAEKYGYQMLLLETRWNGEKEFKALEMLLSRALDGILMYSRIFERETERVTELCGENSPVVVLGISDLKNFSSVSFDFGSGMRMLFKQLTAHDITNIAIIDDRNLGIPRPIDATLPHTEQKFTLKHTAYTAACLQFGITPNYFDFSYSDETTIKACMTQLVKRPPQALIASSDYISARCIQALSAAGLSVPKDVKVISLDGTNWSKIYCPSLAAIQQNSSNMAKAAMQELVRLMEQKEGHRNIILSTSLVTGESADIITEEHNPIYLNP